MEANVVDIKASNLESVYVDDFKQEETTDVDDFKLEETFTDVDELL